MRLPPLGQSTMRHWVFSILRVHLLHSRASATTDATALGTAQDRSLAALVDWPDKSLNLAGRYPSKLTEMRALFDAEAAKYWL